MKNDKLQNLVSIIQIVSSLAVIVSIGLIIIEYHRSGVLNEHQVENKVYDRMMELDRLVIENADFATIKLKAYETPDSLTQEELFRYLAYEHIFYDSWETLWVGYKNGLVEEETWQDWNEWFLRENAKKPAMALLGNESNFSSEFIKYLRGN